jgi:inner membrane protein
VATPVGHSLAAYAVYNFFASRTGRKDCRWLLSSVSVANAPDLDFVPGLFLGQPALYHQGITHSLSGAVAVGLLLAAIFYIRGESFRQVFGFFFLAYLSHLIIDLLGPDKRPPYGIPLFWPISDVYLISPVSLFWGMHHGGLVSTEEWLDAIFSLTNLAAIAIEIAWLTPVIVLLSRKR